LTPHFSELGLTIIPSRDPNAPTTPPDATVMNIENTYMKNTSGIGALGKLAITGQFPPRPGHGTIGKKIAIFANYFKIQAAPNLFLTRYNVEIKPEVRGRKLSRVFQLLLELPQFAGVASDWKSMIVARQALSIQDGEIFEIPYRGDGEDEPLPHPIIYQVRVVTPLSLGVTDLVNYLSGTASGPDFPQKLEVIQVLNVLFGSYPQSSDGTASIAGNRHFSIDHGKQARNIQVLGGGLESLRGYYQSVRPATGGILLNINVTHGVFFEPLRLDLLFPQDGRKAGEQHPPQVKGFGAGPKDVKFWLSDVPPAAATAGAKPAGKAPKKSTGPPLPKNTYISVFDYFRNSELLW
jgi:eukaryotic translation initiation factor 2C